MSESRTRRMALLVGLPVVAALITGIVIYLLATSWVASAEDERDAALARIEALESEIASLETRLAGSDDPLPAVTPAAEEPDPPPGADPDPNATADGRYFCFVREIVNETGTTVITVDFAEFLTGAEAAAAATAAGEESPPPNDYWISNVNPRLRTFPVKADINVRLVSTSDGVNMAGYDAALGQWQDFWAGMSPGLEHIRDVPYWIEVAGGTVTSIKEQYIP